MLCRAYDREGSIATIRRREAAAGQDPPFGFSPHSGYSRRSAEFTRVMALFAAEGEAVLILCSDGFLATDVRLLVTYCELLPCPGCWYGWAGIPNMCMSPVLCAVAFLGLVSCGTATAGNTSATEDVATAHAIKPGLVYGGVAFANIGGGVRPGGTYASNPNLQLDVAAAAVFGWRYIVTCLDALCLQDGLLQHKAEHIEGIHHVSHKAAVAKWGDRFWHYSQSYRTDQLSPKLPTSE